MATGTRDPHGVREDSTAERTLSRYDLLLFVIPATFLVAVLVWQVAAVPVSTAMAGASLVGALAVADGLFVNPPIEPNG